MLDLTSLSKAQLIELVRLALSRGTLLDADIAQSKRQVLHAVCGLFGGIRASARKSGLDAGNLNRWLLGHPTLASEKVDVLLEALGLPDMHPREDIVYVWQPGRYCDLKTAFSLYFRAETSVALGREVMMRQPVAKGLRLSGVAAMLSPSGCAPHY